MTILPNSKTPRYAHALSIGATGMLSGATKHIDACSTSQTLLARHASAFIQQAPLANTRAIDVDWHDTDKYLNATAQAIHIYGPADLCLLWLHQSASAVLDPLLALLGEHPCRLIHVLGSSSDDPREAADRIRQRLRNHPAVTYHTVTLGSIRDGQAWRWLTHTEIAGGAITCEREHRDVVVGEVSAPGPDYPASPHR